MSLARSIWLCPLLALLCLVPSPGRAACRGLLDERTVPQGTTPTKSRTVLTGRVAGGATVTSDRKDAKFGVGIPTADFTTTPGTVRLTVDVYSTPDQICPGGRDLVEVVLMHSKAGVLPLETIAVVEPTADHNHFKIVKSYTLEALRTLLPERIRPGNTDDLKKLFSIWVVRTIWYERNEAGTDNQELHWSGGLDNKQGAGFIRFAAPTPDEDTEAEAAYLEAWNAGKKRVDEDGIGKAARAQLLKDHPYVLRADGELTTGLEAESEYQMTGDDPAGAWNGFVTRMGALCSTWGTAVDGVSTCTTLARAATDAGIHGLKKTAAKAYTDTYYDYKLSGPGGGELDKYKFPLLNKGVFIRRRQVPGDPRDLVLVSLKGRSVMPVESDAIGRIRLSTQAWIKKDLAEVGATTNFLKFIQDTNTKNPFARIFRDAVGSGANDLFTKANAKTVEFKPVLKVVSTRHKFSLELADSVSVDFSADDAVASDIRESRPVDGRVHYYSVEFGLGHPGASQAGVSTATTATREFHIPRDLDNPALAQRADYLAYTRARDAVVTYLEMGENKVPGGEKAKVLAKQFTGILK